MFHMVEDCRFEAAEGKIKILAVEQAAGKPDGITIAILRKTIDCRAARITEPKKFGNFVKRLAGSIIEGLTQKAWFAGFVHMN